jgi:hypothetical protein
MTISGLALLGSSEGFGSGTNGIVIKPAIGYFLSGKTSIDVSFSCATMKNVKLENIYSYFNAYAFIPTLRNNFVNKQKLRGICGIWFWTSSYKI